MKKTKQKLRDYIRGYRYGWRNLPYTLVPNMNPDVSRGWGAGQAWLYRQIEN